MCECVRHILFPGHGVCARVPLSKLFGWRTFSVKFAWPAPSACRPWILLLARHCQRSSLMAPDGALGAQKTIHQFVCMCTLVCTWCGRLSRQVIPHDWPNCQSGQKHSHHPTRCEWKTNSILPIPRTFKGLTLNIFALSLCLLRVDFLYIK